jgi:hypothetical protein
MPSRSPGRCSRSPRALIAGILIAHAPAAIPAVTFAPLCTVLVLHAAAGRGTPGRLRGQRARTP